MAHHLTYSREFNEKIIINDQDPDMVPFEFNVPDPPNKKFILNYDLPVSQQKWRIPHQEFCIPYFSEKKFLALKSKFEYETFEEQEVERRVKGFWIYINGKPRYLTGLNYFYLAHWYIDIGYPEYRSRDMKWFYMWDICVKDDRCLGMVYVKHRREGATYRAGCINYETISRTYQSHGGIQSKSEKDAYKVFRKAVVLPWRKLVPFFRPKYDGSTNPKEALNFIEPSTKTSSRNTDLEFENNSLESVIDYGPQIEEHYDGDKLQFIHYDEVGKTTKADVSVRWDIGRECVTQGGGKVVIGKALHTSTVAEMEKKGGANLYKVWKDSNPRKRNKNGQTTSGLYPYFCPAYDGLESFIDEFGDSMIEEAKQFLQNTIDDLKEKGNYSGLNEHRRKFPWTSKQAFMGDAKKCSFNLEKITERLNILEGNDLWVRGKLEWVPETLPDGTVKTKFTKVKFTPSESGLFEFCQRLAPHEMNNVETDWNSNYKPRNKDIFAVGIDPYDHKVVSTSTPSDGAIKGIRKYNPLIDSESKPKSEWTTHKMFVRFRARPAPKIFNENVAMLLWYLGCQALIEKNKVTLIHFLESVGMRDFIARRPPSTFGVTPSSQDGEQLGVDGSDLLHEAMFFAIENYVDDYWELIDDDNFLMDIREADITKLTPSDDTVAGGLALLLAKPYIRAPEAHAPEQLVFVETYNNTGDFSELVE